MPARRFNLNTNDDARQIGTRVIAIMLFALVILPLFNARATHAATAQNSQSPLGLNLNGVNYYTPEQPFLDIFKTTSVSKGLPGWTTSGAAAFDTGEEQYLQLDANGYPTTLTARSADPNSPQKFGWVVLYILYNLPNSNAGTGLPYRSGQYVVLYDGQGTITYGGDAQLQSSTSGRDVLNVATPSFGGFSIAIHATDPNHTGNYIRNIRVVKAEEESLLTGGGVFRPGFLTTLQNIHTLRFMDWLDINGSPLTSWANRPQTTDGGWGTTNGVPLETAVQLCNAVGADCWLNVPHQADSNYITQMAALVHSMLGTSQKVYIEFSNEVWNAAFPQYVYAVNHGKAAWPGVAGVSDFDYNRSWYGMRVAQMCDSWKSTWGNDSSRVVCVLGAQAASTYPATQSLNCPLWTGPGNAPCSSHGIGAVAIAPYFGNFQAQPSWTSDSDGGLSKVFREFNQGGLISGDFPGGDLAQTSSWEAAYKTALAPYKLPFIAYEGGQTLLGFPTYLNGSAIVNLYIAANRDTRMGTVYTTALNNWKANGGGLYMVFQDVYRPTQYGEWGLLESFLDTTTPLSNAPPKWQAVQNFITGNNCWWSSCAGTIGGPSTTSTPTVPMPPRR